MKHEYTLRVINLTDILNELNYDRDKCNEVFEEINISNICYNPEIQDTLLTPRLLLSEAIDEELFPELFNALESEKLYDYMICIQ